MNKLVCSLCLGALSIRFRSVEMKNGGIEVAYGRRQLEARKRSSTIAGTVRMMGPGLVYVSQVMSMRPVVLRRGQ